MLLRAVRDAWRVIRFMPAPASLPEKNDEAIPGIAQAASLVALGNVASRLLGLAREILSASLFGASGLVSAFGVANIVPKQLYDLLIGGMLHSALVPVFSEYAALKEREELWRLFSVILTVTAFFLSLVVIFLELVAPLLVRLIAGGFAPEQRLVTLSLVRLMLPAVILLSLAGVVTALLYAQQRFLFPSLGVAVYNAGIIAAMLLLARQLDIYSLAVGVVAAAFLQLAIQLPELRGVPIRLRLDLRHPALKRVLALYAPVVAGLVISLVQVTIDRRLASGTGESSIAWMDKATTLVQSAHGLVAVAISTAVLPLLARSSARGEWQAYRDTLGFSLRLALLLIVPLAVGLEILAEPLVALLFQHGAFGATDTFWTAWALRLYLLGLVFATIDWPLNYAFYARQDTLTPAAVGVLSVLIYLAAALLLLRPLQMLGLVLADSCKHFGHALIMLALTQRRTGGLQGQRLLIALGKILAASLIMAGAMMLAGRAMAWPPSQATIWQRLLAVALPASVGAAAYIGAVFALRIGEAQRLAQAAANRVAKFRESRRVR